jgi:hypothetical protein
LPIPLRPFFCWQTVHRASLHPKMCGQPSRRHQKEKARLGRKSGPSGNPLKNAHEVRPAT